MPRVGGGCDTTHSDKLQAASDNAEKRHTLLPGRAREPDRGAETLR